MAYDTYRSIRDINSLPRLRHNENDFETISRRDLDNHVAESLCRLHNTYFTIPHDDISEIPALYTDQSIVGNWD